MAIYYESPKDVHGRKEKKLYKRLRKGIYKYTQRKFQKWTGGSCSVFVFILILSEV